MAIDILRTKQYASWFFGAQAPGQRMYAIPRYKYMFYARFNINAQALSMFPDQMLIGSTTGVSFKIKTIDKPNIELNQKELNQYNRKRYAYTKTEYRPVNISLYDTVDNKPFNLWIQYFNYYFGDARYKSSMTMQSSPVDSTFDDSTGWGLRPLVEQINFFTSVDLYAIFGKEYTLTSYLNPKISAIDWGNHDSSDSNLEELKMSLTYETLQYDTGTITPELAAQFGFDVGQSTLEPNNVQVPIVSKRPANPTGYIYSEDLEAALTSPSLGVLSNFGMSGSSYNALTIGIRALSTGAAFQVQYSSGPGANDSFYAADGFGNEQSSIPVGANYGITGLPGGQLPYSNQFIPFDNTDSFASIGGFGVYNLLGSFGNFNFGAGQFRTSGPSNYTTSYDPLTGSTNVRPGVTNDTSDGTALPYRYPGEQGISVEIGVPTRYNSYYRNNGQQYLTQQQQIQRERRRVQLGEPSLVIEIGNPDYTNNGIYSGYNRSSYLPAPYPAFGPNLDESAAVSNNTGGSFGYLDDPSIFGGDTSDSTPPPVVIPYDNNSY